METKITISDKYEMSDGYANKTTPEDFISEIRWSIENNKDKIQQLLDSIDECNVDVDITISIRPSYI